MRRFPTSFSALQRVEILLMTGGQDLVQHCVFSPVVQAWKEDIWSINIYKGEWGVSKKDITDYTEDFHEERLKKLGGNYELTKGIWRKPVKKGSSFSEMEAGPETVVVTTGAGLG